MRLRKKMMARCSEKARAASLTAGDVASYKTMYKGDVFAKWIGFV